MSTKPPLILTLWAGLASGGAIPLTAIPITLASQAPAAGSVDSNSALHDGARAGISFSDADPRISEAHDLYLDHRVMESLQLFEDVVDEFPEIYEALWGAARSAIAQGLLKLLLKSHPFQFDIAKSDPMLSAVGLLPGSRPL